MFDISLLTDNCILICPSNIKHFLISSLSKNNKQIRMKFLSKKEIQEGISFSYDDFALAYLKNKYGFNYVNAEEILKNLLDEEKTYSTDKTRLMHQYYLELKEQGFLHFNNLFKYLFRDKDVFIYGYSSKDKELISLIDKCCSSYKFLPTIDNSYHHNYYEFNTIEEETLFVFSDIMKKIQSGVDINSIHLMKYSKDYDLIVKKYAHYFHLPIDYNDDNHLYDSPIYKQFLLLLNEHEIVEAYEMLKESVHNDPLDALGHLANVINRILPISLSKEEFIELLSYLANKTPLRALKYDSVIDLINSNDLINEDDYVYILGFSLGSYPSIIRDVDFYSDKEKEEIGLNTSLLNSEIEEENLINFINHTKNLIITHKNKIGKTVFYPSLLIEKLSMDKLIPEKDNRRFNLLMAELESAKAKDNHRIYGSVDAAFDYFKDEDIHYMEYNHSYKGNVHIDSNLNISYTQISEYNRCPFQYFVKRILHADIFEDRFTTELGNLFHLILEDSAHKPIVLTNYDNYIAEHFKTAKDLFFLNMLLPQVLKVIDKNKLFLGNSQYRNVKAEKVIKVQIDEKTSMTGKIDKILFDYSDKSLAVVDYKTGDFYADMQKFDYGVDLQLPIYAYLLSKEYPDYYNTGMFIQNICLNKKTLEDPKNKPYRLDGLMSNNATKLFRLDASLGHIYDEDEKLIRDSQFISGLVLKGKGDIKDNKRLLKEDDFLNLKDVALKQIQQTLANIREGHFDIAPVIFSGERWKICDSCPCKGICFVKKEDYRFIDLKKDKED